MLIYYDAISKILFNVHFHAFKKGNAVGRGECGVFLLAII
jgi:hypothetical protein